MVFTSSSPFSKIEVFIADDHDVVIRGLEDILKDHSDIKVVGAACGSTELISGVLKTKPDVVLLDVRMPNFNVVTAVEELSSLAANGDMEMPRIILVTAHLDAYLASRAQQLGVAGYLLKEEALSRSLPEAIRLVHSGSWAYSGEVQKLLNSSSRTVDGVSFGAQQFSVLALMVDGHTPQEIAHLLRKSLISIYSIQHRIREKMNVGTNAQAVSKAIQDGIVPLGRQ